MSQISVPPQQTLEFTKLLVRPPVQLTGLGARDSLRLEAGMCLYGHDLDEDTTPIEAGLSWVIGKERKGTGGFIGAEALQKQIKNGPPRRRVGLIIEGAPARGIVSSLFFYISPSNFSISSEGAKIFTPDGAETLGTVTSGIPSPTVGKNIAMGYIRSGHHKKGTEIAVDVRNKLRKAVVTPMPFVKTKYWRGLDVKS